MAIPIEYSRFQSPEGYQGALGDVNAQWLLKVLKGAPGGVQPREQALIERLRKEYATPNGGLNLPADILDVIRKEASGGPATSDAERLSAVQMPSWSPVGGVTGGPSSTATAPTGATPSIRKYVSAKDAFAQMRANPNMPTPTLGVSPLQNPVKKYQSPKKIPTQTTPVATSPFRPDWMNQANELLGSSNPPVPQIPSFTGNNIASGTATPATSLSGTATSTVTPNTGATPQDSFVNPASGVNRRKQSSANKYFNRQWFGKALA